MGTDHTPAANLAARTAAASGREGWCNTDGWGTLRQRLAGGRVIGSPHAFAKRPCGEIPQGADDFVASLSPDAMKRLCDFFRILHAWDLALRGEDTLAA